MNVPENIHKLPFVDIDELVEKPVEPKLLLERVSALLQTSEARKAKTETKTKAKGK